jgi:hypothetical protein
MLHKYIFQNGMFNKFYYIYPFFIDRIYDLYSLYMYIYED